MEILAVRRRGCVCVLARALYRAKFKINRLRENRRHFKNALFLRSDIADGTM